MGINAASAALFAVIASAGWVFLGTVIPAKSSLPVAAVLLAASILGVIYIDAQITRETVYPRSIESTALVLSDRRMGYNRNAVVRLRSGQFRRNSKLVLKHNGELHPGDVISFSGEITEFRRAAEPRNFDEFLYWKARGASVSVNVRNVEVIGREFGMPYVRYLLGERVRTMLPRRTSGYISAAWLGERDGDLAELHRQAGTSHILAVSGLHIGMAYGMCWFLLRGFRYRLYIISAVIWSYALLAGASPSALRAALMLQFVIAGKILGESGGTFNGACVAASLMLLWNPWLFWDVGWRMSVLCVMALTSLFRLDIGKRAKFLISSPLLWLASSMQAAWTFGSVPLAGIVINFFAVPFFGIMLPAASILSLPVLAGMRGGIYFTMPVEICFAMWEGISNNITFLIPQRADFSYPMLAGGALAMTYLFARACGFTNSRAYFATGGAAILMTYLIQSGAF